MARPISDIFHLLPLPDQQETLGVLGVRGVLLVKPHLFSSSSHSRLCTLFSVFRLVDIPLSHLHFYSSPSADPLTATVVRCEYPIDRKNDVH